MKFSSVHGQNITLSDHSRTATWETKDSGSWGCSSLALKPGQKVLVQLEGSCHCELGFIKDNPKIANMERPLFYQLNEIRIHKRSCIVAVSLDIRGTEIRSEFQEKVFNKTLEPDVTPWLTFYVKFGEVSVRLRVNGSDDDLLPFSGNHGPNIELHEHSRLARTITQSPASLCFVKKKIAAGETVTLQCLPVLEGDREPSKYHVKLHVYHKHPDSLKREFRYLFEATSSYTAEPPFTSLGVLEKLDCKGKVTVTIQSQSTVSVRTASGKYLETALQRTASEGLWLLLNLYRTQVSVTKTATPASVATDQVDALIQEPSNELAENTIDVNNDSFISSTKLKRRYSGGDYSYVSGPSKPEDNDIGKRLTNLERSHKCLLEDHRKMQETIQDLTNGRKSRKSPTSSNFPVSAKFPASANIPVSNNFPSASSNSASSNFPVSSESFGGDREIDIRPNYTRLVSDLEAVPLRDLLFEKEIISNEELEKISSERTNTEMNRTLLKTISKKHVKQSVMDRLLELSGQTHLQGLL